MKGSMERPSCQAIIHPNWSRLKLPRAIDYMCRPRKHRKHSAITIKLAKEADVFSPFLFSNSLYYSYTLHTHTHWLLVALQFKENKIHVKETRVKCHKLPIWNNDTQTEVWNVLHRLYEDWRHTGEYRDVHSCITACHVTTAYDNNLLKTICCCSRLSPQQHDILYVGQGCPWSQ